MQFVLHLVVSSKRSRTPLPQLLLKMRAHLPTCRAIIGSIPHRFLCECRRYSCFVATHRYYFITGFDRSWFACGLLAAACGFRANVAPISFSINFAPFTSPFDKRGLSVPETTVDHGLDNFGTAQLDELAQLLNVLVGEMSLIGPRPLLPEDQPKNSKLRLLARPGITGWAQVNGGNSLTDDEKGALDEWYVRRASFGSIRSSIDAWLYVSEGAPF